MADDGHDNHDHEPDLSDLTRNERLVYDALKAAGKPQKAYDLLDRLKDRGVRAPMTIYRSLEGLVAKGIVHKLDALNSFVLCTHEAPHQIQSFLVCDDCNAVEEINTNVPAAPAVESNIRTVAVEKGFRMAEARLEVKGTCARCA